MIETERLILRPWKDSDVEPFARLNADPRVMEFMLKPLARDECEGWVERIRAHFDEHGFGLYAAEWKGNGLFIGYIGICIPTYDTPFSPFVEIGWRLAAAYWNRGLATEGARAVLREGFEAYRLPEILSFTVPANVRSRRVMEKIGMVHDPAGDFDHPRVPAGHPLQRHVLYRCRNPNLNSSASPIDRRAQVV